MNEKKQPQKGDGNKADEQLDADLEITGFGSSPQVGFDTVIQKVHDKAQELRERANSLPCDLIQGGF